MTLKEIVELNLVNYQNNANFTILKIRIFSF